MNVFSRRDVGKAALAGAALYATGGASWAAPHLDSTVRGVKLGLITGSLNPLPSPPPGVDKIDQVIQECIACKAGNIEFVNSLLEPLPPTMGRGSQVPDKITPEYTADREKMHQWRLNAPLDLYRGVRKKFTDAGLNLFSYVMTFSDDTQDDEIDAVFKQMQALGVRVFCTNQTRSSFGPRLVPFAAKYKISPAWHTHDKSEDPNEVASAESLEKLIAMSPDFRINLDIGHFTAGNQDSVDFIRKHHDKISHIHVKDRKRNKGPNVAFGDGDTPIKPVLQLIRDNRWPIVAVIEREFKGDGTPVEQTTKDIAYMRAALES
jgi:sugar phosphate isomerase/epimerase